MPRSRLVVVLCAAALVGGLLFYRYGSSTPPTGQPRLASLNARNFDELKREFNNAQGMVRVVALLSPT